MKKEYNHKVKIIIADEIPSYNRGEEAILLGILEGIKHANMPVDEISLCSNNVLEDSAQYENLVSVIDSKTSTKTDRLKRSVEIILFGFTSRLNKKLATKLFKNRLWEKYLSANVILFGHDNTLASKYPSIWFVANVLYAKLTHKKTFIIAGSIGPFSKGIGTFLGSLLLKQTDVVTIRDPLSYEHAKSITNQSKNIYLTGDTAFLVNAADKSFGEQCIKDLGILNTRPLIGITASRASGPFRHAFLSIECDIPQDPDKKETLHVKELATTLDYLIQNLEVNIIFLPHCVGPGLLDDRKVARKIYEVMEKKEHVYLLEEKYSVRELKSIMGHFAFFIGERTHSVIGAVSMGIPSIAISFPTDYRTYGIIGTMVEIPDHLYNIEELRSSTLTKKILECWEKREQIKFHLSDRMPKIKEGAALFGALLSRTVSNTDSEPDTVTSQK